MALSAMRRKPPALGGAGSEMFARDTARRVKSANQTLTLVEAEAGHDVRGDDPAARLAEIGEFLDGME